LQTHVQDGTACAKNVKGFLSYAKYCIEFRDASMHKADYY